MPRLTTPQALDRLLELIAHYPDGIGIDALLQAHGNPLQRRTLQRRLAKLVAQGRIQTQGEARAVRYQSVAQPHDLDATAQTQATVQAAADIYVPTSPEGAAIKAFVRQPRQLRPPVGYKLEFLEQYHPNHTAYLPT